MTLGYSAFLVTRKTSRVIPTYLNIYLLYLHLIAEFLTLLRKRHPHNKITEKSSYVYSCRAGSK